MCAMEGEILLPQLTANCRQRSYENIKIWWCDCEMINHPIFTTLDTPFQSLKWGIHGGDHKGYGLPGCNAV